MNGRIVLVVALLVVGLGGWAFLARDAAPRSANAPVAVQEPSADSAISTRPLRQRAEPEPPSGETEPAKTSRLTIHVLDDDTGAPLANAKVRYESGDVERSATADAAGTARIEIDREKGVTFLVTAPGHVRDGWRRAYDEFGETAQDADREVTIRLAPSTSLHGVVVDATTGAPVAGARLRAERGGEAQMNCFGPPDAPYCEVVGSADGTFCLDGIPPAGPTNVYVSAPGHARQDAEWDASKPRRIEFRMEPAGSVRGVVREADGKPVEGLRVSARRSGEGWFPTEEATTGADGSYEIEGLAFDHAYDVVALEQWYDPLRASAATEAVVPTADAPQATRDLQMLRPAKLTVRVRDRDGGAVADALVRVEMSGLSRRFSIDAAGDGTAVIERPGHCVLLVVSPRFVPQVQLHDVAEGAALVVEVVLPRGVELRGVVVDEDGTPIAAADVEAQLQTTMPNSRWSSWEIRGTATTASDGSFALSGCKHETYVVEASAADHETARIEDVDAPRSDLRLVLPKRPTETIALRLAEKDVVVDLWFAAVDSEASSHQSVLTDDADPAHEVEIRAGTYDLGMTAAGFAGTTRRVVVTAGETLDLGDIALDRGISLAGRVVDAEGRAVASATVKAIVVDTARFDADRDPNPVAWSDDAGAFRLSHLAAGEATLRVVAGGFVAANVRCDVRAGAAPVVVTLVRDVESSPETR